MHHNISSKRQPYKKITFETRQAIVRGFQANMSVRSLCTIFNLAKSSVWGIYESFKKKGKIELGKKGGVTRKKYDDNILEFVKELVTTNCFVSLINVQQEVLNKYNVNVSHKTISKWLKKMNIDRKVLIKVGFL